MECHTVRVPSLPFGLHDLEVSLQLCGALGLETAVVINRSDRGDDRVRSFLTDEGVPVWAEVPFEARQARNKSTTTRPGPSLGDRHRALLRPVEADPQLAEE